MVKGLCWLAVATCFTLQWEFLHGRKRATCQSVCDGVGVPDGCKYAQDTSAGPEEVVVITNGLSDIQSWKWDTISMVVSTHFSSLKQTGHTACYTHSQGKRYGLREYMPSDLDELVASTNDVKVKFTEMILTYQQLMMADLMVFDFLDFFHKLDAGQSVVNVTATLSKMADVLSYATGKVQAQHPGEVYCIVPWKPPCEEEQCGALRGLLSSCHVLLMSPDSYQPEVAAGDQCLAQATVPISQFLYGIDRYLSLLAKPYPSTHIVAGIPWHGYEYKCDQPISHDDRCVISKKAGQACFSSSNRQRLSLSDIHSRSIAQSQVNMDVITKGLYYRLNDTSQLWFENYTTLLIKYQLVKDLNLRGLSLWYGEDLAFGLSPDKTKFSMDSWSFLMHHVLHKAVYTPHTISHYYADTVAGIGVGCLLLGTLLGVIFTCIGFQRSKFRKLNRPFKLDEDENAFRDDEGL